MKNLEYIADELFNKIRGRYPSVTVGDNDATITNMPKEGRFFEFDFQPGKKVSISLDENGIAVMFSTKLFDSNDASLKSNWFSFLKELRLFAKKRMLNFDTRDITKNSLDKRDYEYLSTEKQMSESKLYGTSRTSFQDIGSAKMIVKHTQPINHEQPAGRTRDIAGIYIESENGERFKYPMKHLNGARAMTRHVSEGGNPYDDFGKHIIGLSEELSKLRKFKTYMNRSSVMAESLAGYLDVVNERIEAVKKTAHALQSVSHYKEAFENFETTVLEEVPEDVSNSWIDELTIKQFNEELKGVFPYIYKLVSEANRVDELGPEDLLGENVEEKVKMMISKSQEPEQAIENLMKEKGPEGDFIRREYEITAGENGLHGDDDHETIIDIMVDDIGVAEDTVGERDSMGMNKYGLAAEKKGDKFISYKDGKVTGEFDSMEELKKHQTELIQDESMGDDTVPEGVTRNALYQKVGKMLGKGHDINAIKKRYKDIDDAHPGHIEKIVQALKDRNEIPQDLKRIKGSDPMASETYGFEELADEIVNGAEFNREPLAYEGNEFAQKVRELKAKGAKPGTKFKTSDGEEHTLESAIEDAGMDILEFWTEDELEESGIMYRAGVKKYGKDGMKKIQSAAGKGASAEEIGKIKDQHNKKKTEEDERTDEIAPLAIPAIAMIGRMAVGALAKGLAKKGAKEAVKGMAKQAAKGGAKVAKQAAKTAAKNPGKVAVGAGGIYAIDKLNDFKDFIVDSVESIMEYLPDIPGAAAIARMAAKYALPASVAVIVAYGGYKLIDKALDKSEEQPEKEDEKDITIDVNPKGKHDEMKPKNEIPLEEFIKSMYDYTQNAFPKGETAVLTAVQKDYGDEHVGEAQQIISELLRGQDEEMARIQHLAGLRQPKLQKKSKKTLDFINNIMYNVNYCACSGTKL